MAKISLGVCLMFLVVSSTVYEVQGTFLLRRYMRRCPLRRAAFRPFACRGMLKFCGLLQHRCPLTSHYRNFFGAMKTFLSFVESSSGSSNFNADLKTQAQGVQSAMSQMGGSADSNNVMNVLISMGKTLGDTENSDSSTLLTRSQRRELIFSMITWARTIAEFVVSTSSNSGGASINMSSLGVDDDGDSPKSSGTSGGSVGAQGSVNTGSTGSTSGSSGGSFEAKGSVNAGSSGSSSGSSTGSNTGSTTGSTCNTCGGNTNGGGSSFKGSLNVQSGHQSSQDSSMNNAH